VGDRGIHWGIGRSHDKHMGQGDFLLSDKWLL